MADARGLHPPEKVADYRARGWWGEQTLDGIFADQVRARGDALAVVDPANREALLGSSPRRLTWRELDAEVTALAARLLSLGLGRGDVLGVQLANTVELVEVYLAAWRLGVVVSPLPVQLREREVATMCARADVTAYLSCARFGDRAPGRGRRHGARRRGLGARRRRIRPRGGEQRTCRSASACGIRARPPGADREAVEAYAADDPNEANDAVTICWTSGTESAPKGVPALSHGLAGRRHRDDRGAAGHDRRRAAQPVPDDQHGRHQRDVPAVAAHRVRPRAAPPLRPADVPRAGRRRARHLHVRAAGAALDAARQRGRSWRRSTSAA